MLPSSKKSRFRILYYGFYYASILNKEIETVIMLYGTLLYYTKIYNIILFNNILYHTIQPYIVPYHTIPYHTIQYHTIPYRTLTYHTMFIWHLTQHYHKKYTNIHNARHFLAHVCTTARPKVIERTE